MKSKMNSVCPICGGGLGEISGDVDVRSQISTKHLGFFYGCRDCHLVFWATENDPIPPKKD